MTWQEILMRFVTAKGGSHFPVFVYNFEPPSNREVPTGLPSSPIIREFYKICDGGIIDDFRITSVSELTALNDTWRKSLIGYYPTGLSPLGEEHLVLGTDGAGAPLVWDSTRDNLSTFWFKGGDWEPLNQSFEEFLNQYLVNYAPVEDGDLWYEALTLAKSQV